MAAKRNHKPVKVGEVEFDVGGRRHAGDKSLVICRFSDRWHRWKDKVR